MFKFEREISINRPQQEIFDFITDPANDPKWRESSVSAEWTSDGPIGVGSTQHAIDKLLGRQIESDSEVTVWDPPNQFGWKAIGGPVPYDLKISLSSQRNGTQITFSGQAEIGGFFKLAEGLAGRQMEKQIEADFKNLKHLMEGTKV